MVRISIFRTFLALPVILNNLILFTFILFAKISITTHVMLFRAFLALSNFVKVCILRAVTSILLAPGAAFVDVKVFIAIYTPASDTKVLVLLSIVTCVLKAFCSCLIEICLSRAFLTSTVQ